MGTTLENTKTDLAFQQKINKQNKDELQLMRKEIDNLNLRLKQKEQSVEQNNVDKSLFTNKLKDKESEIQKAKAK